MDNEVTASRVSAALERAKKATEGPWCGYKSATCGHLRMFKGGDAHEIEWDKAPEIVWKQDNVSFVKHSRLDVPDFAAHIQRQHELLQQIVAKMIHDEDDLYHSQWTPEFYKLILSELAAYEAEGELT